VKQIRQRLTYANVMSSIAVFFVLSGATAFAATKIGSGQLKANSVLTGKIKKEAVTTSKIKNNSITTSKIADKAVTGAKIDPVGLGTVPNATNAVNATNATHAVNATNAVNAQKAGSINGQSLHKILFRTTSDSGTVGPQTVFNSGGLQINVICTNGQATVTATTTKNDSSIYVNVFDSGSAEVAQEQLESGEFDTGETADMLAGEGGNNDMSLFEFDAVDGSVVTGTINTDEDGALAGCRVTGQAISG
jgi:hypothetical protein